MRRTRFVIAAILLIVPVSSALADDFMCPPILTGVIPGNVVVPIGLTCVLSGAAVQGNVTALEDSRLLINSNTTVQGNVEGHKASAVQVADSTVHGNVFIEEAHDPVIVSALVLRSSILNGNVHILRGRPPLFGDWQVFQSTVLNGNIIAEDNESIFLSRVAQSPFVSGNVQVFKNKGPGLKFVRFNTILQDLQCFENDLPFVGSPNVARKAEGQCGTSLFTLGGEEAEEFPPPNPDGFFEKVPQ